MVIPRFFLSKKGIFLTFIAVLLVSLLLLYASTQYEVSYRETVPTETLRVSGLNNFVSDFEGAYLERALFASSHRELISLIRIAPDGSGSSRIVDINQAFTEAILNGTLTMGNSNIILPEMVNNTLPNWLDNLNNFTQRSLRSGMKYSIRSITITQDDTTGPWFVNVSMSLDYVLGEGSGPAQWTRNNVTIFVSFDILGFEDPYLKFQTDNRLNNTISRFNGTEGSYSPENLTALILSRQFIHDRGS